MLGTWGQFLSLAFVHVDWNPGGSGTKQSITISSTTHDLSYMLHALRSPTRVTPLLWRVMYTGHPTGVHSKTDLISDRTGYSGLPPRAYHILLVPVTLRIPTLRFQIFFLSCTDRWQRFILTPLGVVYREIVFMGFGLNHQKTRCFLAPYLSFWYLSLYFFFNFKFFDSL